MVQVTADQARFFRLKRSGLVEPFADMETAAAQLGGIQAQILVAGAVALWQRTADLTTYDQFEQQLWQERTLVKLWGQRGTLHLYPSQEWPLVQAAFDDKKTWWHRNAESLGMSEAKFHEVVAQIVALLRERGEIGRSDLREELDIADELLSSWGGLFQEMVYRGHACHAGRRGSEGLFAYREYWLPDLVWQPPNLDAANVALLRRYLWAYGPATIQDFAFWRGTGVANGRVWLSQLVEAVTEVDVAGTPMLLLAEDVAALAEPVPETWPVRLLYRFDPLLLAHKDKSFWLDMAFYKRVWQAAGHIEGTVLDRGRIVGTWRYDRKGSGLAVTVYPFGSLRRGVRGQIRQQARGIARFLGQKLGDLQYAVNSND